MTMTFSDNEVLRSIDFESMSADEIARAKRAVAAMRLDLKPLATRRHVRDSTGERVDMRATLREAGTWTTVAQFTLLFIGMLCVFQVVVLLVVNQFLSQAASDQTVAADMLSAHAKVATVMLPALVGGAIAAAALAAWRAYTDPRQREDTSGLRRWVLGLPVAVWGVLATAMGLLLVVLFAGSSGTVAEALDRAAADFRELGERAQKRGLRVGFEALAWGGHISDHRDAWEVALSTFEIDLLRNGEVMDHGRAANVLDGPLSALRHFNEVLATDPINPPLAAGELVTTGTLTRAFPIEPGETWSTRPQGIALDGIETMNTMLKTMRK